MDGVQYFYRVQVDPTSEFQSDKTVSKFSLCALNYDYLEKLGLEKVNR